ncbi:MAG TPA: bifunctional diaminohydroxyphosphoribosylaminopyrimidine deaminase/5-amino-6-(5-phosphoribosylamino)uracil reductase RibD [Cyclobacteriaceae bacterium]|nr:bifunctional diaminohydroxyphosphoribosylaminopyrimidine deaminase/5-amino-6-(5-phosphoribosylamino)uracil reductase RibD [Cyclobacteriaceae bacterium]
MDTDLKFMRRALELATWGRGKVSPNPMVGSVIVHNNVIIGEGYHQIYGGPHAEPNAVQAVRQPELLKEATVYVTLEPCAHYGKTPPCAKLLAEKQVKRVVVAITDPNPLVAGKGIKLLTEAGIEVQVGVLEKEAADINKRFFTQVRKQRPYVILKWAQTRDGFVARGDYSSKWISNAHSRQLVHRWRTEEDAIMVGTKTAHFDNPKLNVRHWEGKNPIRVVIDKHLTLDNNLSLFDKSQPTICYNLIKNEIEENLDFVQLRENFTIKDILDDLYRRKVQSLIVEGGSYLLQRFISEELWDEARVFIGQGKFHHGIPAPLLHRKPEETLDIMGDQLYVYKNYSSL